MQTSHNAIVVSGKHPAWADFMPMQGNPAAIVNDTLKNLFMIAELALAEVKSRPDMGLEFDGCFYSKINKDFCFGQILNSKDKVGRPFPLIISAYDNSITPKGCFYKYLPIIDDLQFDFTKVSKPEQVKQSVSLANETLMLEKQALMSGVTVDLQAVTPDSISNMKRFLEKSESNPYAAITEKIPGVDKAFFKQIITNIHNYLIVKKKRKKDDFSFLSPVRVPIDPNEPEDTMRLWSVLIDKMFSSRDFIIIANNDYAFADIIIDDIDKREARFLLSKSLPDYKIENKLDDSTFEAALHLIQDGQNCESILGRAKNRKAHATFSSPSIKADIPINKNESTLLIVGVIAFFVILIAVLILIFVALRLTSEPAFLFYSETLQRLQSLIL